MPPTVSTRFLIISDTHDFDFQHAPGPFRQPVPKADVLLHCGDLTMRGGLDAYTDVLKMLGSIDADLKLVIAGNHDLSLDGPYWQANRGQYDDPEEHRLGKEIMTGPLAKQAGVTYLEEGTYTFDLKNGARLRIYASPYQPEFYNWAFPYERHEDRFNSPEHTAPGITCIAQNPIPSFPDVDVVMTHGPPFQILDLCPGGHVGCESLLRAAERARPLMHCFGHIHEGHGLQKVTWKSDEAGIQGTENYANQYPQAQRVDVVHGRETWMVNAAIMTVEYRPLNPPWLVDLDLPVGVTIEEEL